MRRNFSPTMVDRVVSFLTYITAGWVGLIYCIIMYFRKKSPSKFLRFNVFQSIFLSFLYFILYTVLGFISGLLLYVPFVNYLVSQILLIFNRPVFFDYSIVQVFVLGLFLYLSVVSLFGRYPRIYKISSIIDYAAQ